MLAKLSCFHPTQLCSEQGNEIFIQLICRLRSCRAHIVGAVSLFVISHKRKVGYDKRLAPDILQREIHPVCLVREYSQIERLSCKCLCVSPAIPLGNAEKKHQPLAALSNYSSANADRRSLYTLYNKPHCLSPHYHENPRVTSSTPSRDLSLDTIE